MVSCARHGETRAGHVLTKHLASAGSRICSLTVLLRGLGLCQGFLLVRIIPTIDTARSTQLAHHLRVRISHSHISRSRHSWGRSGYD
jgi:hypothetical protein